MEKHCSYCGLSVTGDDTSCPLCGTRLVAVNLRRALLWALVTQEYLLVAAVMFRFR
jgi:hypothetical protein